MIDLRSHNIRPLLHVILQKVHFYHNIISTLMNKLRWRWKKLRFKAENGRCFPPPSYGYFVMFYWLEEKLKLVVSMSKLPPALINFQCSLPPEKLTMYAQREENSPSSYPLISSYFWTYNFMTIRHCNMIWPGLKIVTKWCSHLLEFWLKILCFPCLMLSGVNN